MRIAVLTFEGFNEIDSFLALAMLNRVGQPKLQALLACPSPRVASMNGVVVEAQAPLSFAREADAVIVGSGTGTRELVKSKELMDQLKLDPARQVIGAQCSGTLVLAKLGLLGELPACTDSTTKRLAGWKAAEAVVHYVAPVGEKADYVARMRSACSESSRLLKAT